jgi:hypothetical protein
MNRASQLSALPYDYPQAIMDRKIFWILFTVLSCGGYFLPFGWAIVEMFVSLFVSWWIVYRSDWL